MVATPISRSYWPADTSEPVLETEPTAEELFAFCRQHLAPHKTPRYWELVECFPMTPSGTVQKFVLRDRFIAAAGQATPHLHNSSHSGRSLSASFYAAQCLIWSMAAAHSSRKLIPELISR